jgi:hypothetical protein
MKRVLQLLMFVIFLVTISYGQQNNLGYVKVNGQVTPANREGELQCAPGSLFGQPPVLPDGGFFCDANDPAQYTEVMEDYPALSGNIAKVTFWVSFYNRNYGDACTPGTPVADSYQVNFYGINGETPSVPGALMQSFTLSPSFYQYVGSFYYPMYRMEFNLPSTVAGSAGWVGLGRLTATDNCILFWWDMNSPGYQYSGIQRHSGAFENTSANFAFCLEGSNNVPLANWPMILAATLIAIAVGARFLRFRS